jgi:putative Mg2+ transporter-C (MgtC) family protein
MTTTFTEFCLRAGVAVLLAGLLGLESSLKNKPVGMRTFMMVALGSACFTMITLNFAASTLTEIESAVSVDPTRVIQGIIGGIGFLGAGAIMSNSEGTNVIRGMGTGAAVWTVGSIGVACAFGYLWEAGFISAVALTILTVASWFENRAKDISESIDKSD